DLKNKLLNYTSHLIAVGGIQSSSVKVEYTVTFDPNNGDAVFTETVAAGNTVAMPTLFDENSSHNGKKFGGWYNGTTKWNFSNPVTGNMTLTAKWLEEGETPEPDPGPGGEDIASTQIHDFTANGKTSTFYTITGNLSTGKGTCTYDGKNLTQCLKMEGDTNISFTAPVDGKLTLVFGGDKDPAPGKKVKINDTAYTCDSNGIVTQDVAKGAVKVTKGETINLFYMVYVPNSSGGGDDTTDYTITIDKADGTATTTLTVKKGTEVTAAQIPTPVREGYEFVRWVDAGGNTVTLPFTPSGNMTIKAEWQAVGEVTPDPDKTYNLELLATDIPGGTYTSDFTKGGFTIHANDAKDDSGKATGNVSVDVASEKTINGKKYTGRLKTNGAGAKDYRSISFTTTGAATLSMACIVATTDDTRTVHVAALNAQGELVDITTGITVDNKAASAISISGSDGNYVTVELPEAATYYIWADGSVNFYAINVTYPNGVAPLFCTVKFDSMGGLSVENQRCLAGETCVEPGETIKDGYVFDGWYTDAACTKKYDFSTSVTQNITLFAKWKLDENGGKYLTLDMKDLPARDYKEKFSKNGFTFAATASKAMAVEASGATVDGVNYTQKLKFNGTGDASARNLSFKVEGNATLTVVVESGNTSTARELVVTNGIEAQNQNITNITTAAKYTKELTAGTWQIYPKKDGMNIYYISVEGAGVVEHYTITIDKKDGSAPTKKTLTAGEQLTAEDLPTLAKEGDTFLGWADENGKILPVPYTPTRSMTITAKWQSDSTQPGPGPNPGPGPDDPIDPDEVGLHV
ncbi:MAG: InlB B-repeat-containing protein, partial [Acetatifactor sp.]|nr:InlB B-repeat-containing protein [Acetatifactor sp.]